MSPFFFYIFAAILILACLAVVLARNPLYNVLALVVAIFSLSCLFVLLEAFFVGMILLLVYAGAVSLVFFPLCGHVPEPSMPLHVGSRPANPLSLAGNMWQGCCSPPHSVLATKSFIKAQTMDPSSIRGTIETIGKILFYGLLLLYLELTSSSFIDCHLWDRFIGSRRIKYG